jgi:hypothetical protein
LFVAAEPPSRATADRASAIAAAGGGTLSARDLVLPDQLLS